MLVRPAEILELKDSERYRNLARSRSGQYRVLAFRFRLLNGVPKFGPAFVLEQLSSSRVERERERRDTRDLVSLVAEIEVCRDALGKLVRVVPL